MGYFSDGQFHLVVSLRYVPDHGEVDFWCVLLQEVSRILNDATDGAHSIGSVCICANSMGGNDVDIWVWDDDIQDNSSGARLWSMGSIDTSRNMAAIPNILAHELGHYLYDLGDEYLVDVSGVALNMCQQNPNTQYSLMESYSVNHYTRWKPITPKAPDFEDWYVVWTDFFPDYQAGQTVLQIGQPTDLCYPGAAGSPRGQNGVHDPAPNTPQNRRNSDSRESCWVYIANDSNHNLIPYQLSVPAGAPLPGALGALPAVICTELIPVQRFLLVLDRSGSMLGAKLDQLKVGANFWVDYVNAGEELGLVSFSTTDRLDSATSPVPPADPASSSWRNARHAIVDNLVASGSTAIGDAMRLGINDILAGGRACSQVMILFTDGLQNAGTETAEAVLPDLVASGVRCYTIGLGNDQDATLLSNIATVTRGRYFAIDGDLSSDQAAAAIAEDLIAIAGESRENGGIVSFRDVDGAASKPIPMNDPEDSIPFIWKNEDGSQSRQEQDRCIESFTFPVNISAGSTHCTLGVLWKQTQQQFQIRIYDPDGIYLVQGAGIRWVNPVNYPYVFCEIDAPKPGTWRVDVLGADVRAAKFRTLGFEVNPRIRFEVRPLETHIKSGSEIEIHACLLAPVVVPDVRITGWIRNLDGAWRRFEFTEWFRDDENQGRFIYRATVPTMVERTGKYLIVVDAYREKGTFEVKRDALYRITPELRTKDTIRTIAVPRIKRRVLLTITADPKGRRPTEPLPGYNAEPPKIPNNQRSMLELWKKQEKEVLWKVTHDQTVS